MVKVVPAILTSSKKDLDNKLLILKDRPLVHIDIEDGTMVENNTISLDDIPQIPYHYQLHLMVDNPLNYIDFIKRLKPFEVVIHREIDNWEDALVQFKKITKVVGALNIDTSYETILEYRNLLDGILVMGVVLGYSGNVFQEEVLLKIQGLRKDTDLNIYVDGGINDKTGKMCKDAGADVLISASYIFSGDVRERIGILENI